MYRHLERRLAQKINDFLHSTYGLTLPRIVIEQPPKSRPGRVCFALAFELAKKLRKAPRKIAEEIVNGIGPIEGFEKLEVAGAGYLNARVNRAEVAKALAGTQPPAEVNLGKVLVEHSSINPNKAAHVGHLRNAILGDTFVRLLREAGREVDVQNYIDNTGVQVADVIVGFLHIEKKSRAEIEQLTLSRVSTTTAGTSTPASRSGTRPTSRICWRAPRRCTPSRQAGMRPPKLPSLISTAVLRRHLETMDRLDIEYDFLPRESEILHLHFWDAAFAKLKESGGSLYEKDGKNKGCWVMRRVRSRRGGRRHASFPRKTRK